MGKYEKLLEEDELTYQGKNLGGDGNHRCAVTEWLGDIPGPAGR